MRWPRRAPTARSALAITDLNNLFGAVKFYSACRGGRQADHRLPTSGSSPKAASKHGQPPAAAGAEPPGLPATCASCWRAAWTAQRAARAGAGQVGLARPSWRRADRAVGRRRRRGRAGAAGRRRGARASAGAAPGGAASRGASTSSCSAPACRRNEAPCARRGAAGRRLELPVVATHPVQFLDARRLRGARGARVRGRGRDAGQPAPRQALLARAVLQDAGADGRRCSPTCRRRSPTRSRSRSAATCSSRSASRSCPTSRRRGRRRMPIDAVLPRARRTTGWTSAWRSSTPTPAERERAARRATSSGSSSRSTPSSRWASRATS